MKIAIIATCLAILSVNTALAQTQSSNLVGTWKLVRSCDPDSISVPSAWGPANPFGYFIYTATGHFSIHALRNQSTRVALPVLRHGVESEKSASYFGRYVVFSDSSVVHYIEGGLVPYYIGPIEARTYLNVGDTLRTARTGTEPRGCSVLARVR